MFGCGIGENLIGSGTLSGGSFFIGLIMMSLRIALLIGLIYLIYRLFFRIKDESSALKILEERYARGEISEEEYFKRKEILK